MKNILEKLLNQLLAIKKQPELTKQDPLTLSAPCCDALVHIAYRGVSDGRLYLVRDKNWQDVKFFRPVGLRVYCQKCRSRIL